MSSVEQIPWRDEDLGRFWDAFVADEPNPTADLNDDAVRAVRAVHDLDDVPGPDPMLVAKMWTDALRLAGSTTAETQRASGFDRLAATADAALRSALAGAAAGLIAGVIALGLGLRIAMRIAGALTDADHRGRLTEAGNQVGRVTLEGTISLVLGGGVIGLALGICYLAVKPWLPCTGWRRGLIFGVGLLAVGGSTLFEQGRNPDYQSFGIAGLNVCAFGVVPVIFGVIVGPLADRFGSRIRHRPMSVGWRRAIPIPALAIGSLLLVLAAPPLAVMFVVLAARMGITDLAGAFRSPADIWYRPAIAVPAYALIVLPCLVGLGYTVIAIERILI